MTTIGYADPKWKEQQSLNSNKCLEISKSHVQLKEMSKRRALKEAEDRPSVCKKLFNGFEEKSAQNSTTGTCGLRNTMHGDVFQLKLLMLFLIRPINAGYQFKLGTEIPGEGGKFDDLIFKYRVDDAITSSWRYRYLQAKHKQDELK